MGRQAKYPKIFETWCRRRIEKNDVLKRVQEEGNVFMGTRRKKNELDKPFAKKRPSTERRQRGKNGWGQEILKKKDTTAGRLQRKKLSTVKKRRGTRGRVERVLFGKTMNPPIGSKQNKNTWMLVLY